MSEALKQEHVNGYLVSTILLKVKSDADFESANIWPFETMVFKDDGQFNGLYHEPSDSKMGALGAHEKAIALAAGESKDWIGHGVDLKAENQNDNISTTCEMWEAKRDGKND